MANSEDPDQTAPSGAVWSGSALFSLVILLETLVYRIITLTRLWIHKLGLVYEILGHYHNQVVDMWADLSFRVCMWPFSCIELWMVSDKISMTNEKKFQVKNIFQCQIIVITGLILYLP